MDWALLLATALLAGALLPLLVALGAFRRLRELGPRVFRRRSAAADQSPRYRDVKFERDIFGDKETDEERERNAWR